MGRGSQIVTKACGLHRFYVAIVKRGSTGICGQASFIKYSLTSDFILRCLFDHSFTHSAAAHFHQCIIRATIEAHRATDEAHTGVPLTFATIQTYRVRDENATH
jgi:hypothetical protein